MTKKLLVAGVLSGLIVAGSIGGIFNQYSYAAQVKTVEGYTKLAGEYIKNNPELLSKSIDAVKNKSVENNDVVTNVDSLPITIGEINFRKGLRQVSGIGDTKDNSIFNTLVEEKSIISYAIKNNVLPAKNEIDDFINSEKLLYAKDDITQKSINAFCLAANMSLEDYWSTYEYYNAFRVVTFKKAYDKAIETGIKKGEVKALDSGKNELNSEIACQYEDYWNKVKKDMKNKTSFKINKQYLDRGFILDNSKSYL